MLCLKPIRIYFAQLKCVYLYIFKNPQNQWVIVSFHCSSETSPLSLIPQRVLCASAPSDVRVPAVCAHRFFAATLSRWVTGRPKKSHDAETQQQQQVCVSCVPGAEHPPLVRFHTSLFSLTVQFKTNKHAKKNKKSNVSLKDSLKLAGKCFLYLWMRLNSVHLRLFFCISGRSYTSF